jgi:hypothetical protein
MELAEPRSAVWDALAHPEAWPSWWRAVERVEVIEPGDPDGVGACRRLTWRVMDWGRQGLERLLAANEARPTIALSAGGTPGPDRTPAPES